MGNCQTNLCENKNSNATQLDNPINVQRLLLKNRKQQTKLPAVPLHIQQTINRLIGQPNLNILSRDSTIWETNIPLRIVYFNEPNAKENIPSGLCTLYLFKQNKEFAGFFRGIINSQGIKQSKHSIYVFPNGDYFIGDKQKDNYGIFIDKDKKYTYEGDWINQKPHGIGKQKTARGLYVGYFFEGKKHGLGKYQFSDGFIYEGEFKHNYIDGKGKYYNQKQGYKYIGQLKSGQKQGEGIEITDQFNYEGKFIKNVKNGYGKITYIGKNIIYEGEFWNNIPHGKGRYIQSGINGKTIEGIFNNGMLQILYPLT